VKINDLKSKIPTLTTGMDLRSFWLEVMGEVEKLGANVILAAWGGSGYENTWLYHLISVKGYVSLRRLWLVSGTRTIPPGWARSVCSTP